MYISAILKNRHSEFQPKAFAKASTMLLINGHHLLLIRARQRVTTRDQILGWSRGCSSLPVGDTEETRDCVIKNDVFYGSF